MKRMLSLVAVMVLSATGAYAVEQQSEPIVRSQEAKVTAKVQSIDSRTRSIVLLGEGGNTESIILPPEVKNFDQIRVGNNVEVQYYRSVLVEMAEPGQSVAPPATESVQVAPKGAKPGAAKATITQRVVTIRAIDKAKGMVTVALPNGELRTVTVKEERLPMLDRIKPGDKLSVTMTEAVAVAVHKR